MRETVPSLVSPSRREIRPIIAALMVGMGLSALDATVVSTALPTIAGDLGGLDHLSWVVTAYLLSTTAAVPVFGKLSDLYGRRRLFRIAVVIFLLGSVCCGVAQNLTQLIVARGLQGIGGGGLQALVFVILADTVSSRERSKYVGSFTAVHAVASVIGPLVGGVFTDAVTWRWAFYVNVPLGMVSLAASKRFRPRPPGSPRPLDVAGVSFLLPGVTSIVLISVWGGQEHGWGSPPILGLSAAAVVFASLFVYRELHTAEPLIPLRLFGMRVIALPTVASVCISAAMTGGMTFLPMYFQVVRGTTATRSGFLMLPMVGGFVASSNIIGRIISKTGAYKRFVLAGAAACTVGMLLLTVLTEHTDPVQVAAGMLMFGLGIGVVMPVLAVCVQNSAPHGDVGAATATLNFFRSIGSVFGVAVMGTVLSARAASVLGDQLDTRVLDSPARMRLLPSAVHDTVVQAILEGVTLVFSIAAVLSLIVFLLSLRIREVPLGETVIAADLDELKISPKEEAPDPRSASRPAPAPATVRVE